MPKITLIGAGSTVFAKTLLGDILSFPELNHSTIALMDIDAERLRTSALVAHKVAKALSAEPNIIATRDRRQALEGADYVINMIQVAGYKPGTVIDFEIPKKYGLRQTIGDTLGIGGIMRALRTIPVLLDICRDMEQVCPDALLLQYSNPMAMNCWAINKASRIRTVGLCHSVQGTAAQLARDIGVPYDEIEYLSAGINHMAFYLKFARNGEDLYPRIRQVIADKRVPDWNRVRYEVLNRFGYFVTESSEHFAEYVPWFIKRDGEDIIEEFNIPLDEYMRRCEAQIAGWRAMQEYLEADGDVKIERSHEYGALIIHSIESDTPRTVYGNVMNSALSQAGNGVEPSRLIDNLPRESCVEVPCLVDKHGLKPQHVGKIPPQLAALMNTNINVQALTVEAALTRRREHVYHAAMLDPHTAAELPLDQIKALVDELIAAHGAWIPSLN